MKKIDSAANEEDARHAPNAQAASFDMRERDPGQSTLFPTEDLVIPDALRTMRKAVSAIHALPAKMEHAQNLNSRRLFDACILIAQVDFRKRGPEALQKVVAERLAPVFETRITDLARLAGIPGKNLDRIYQELDQLFEMTLRWNIVGEDANVEWEMKSHFLSSLGHGKGRKRGLVRFSLDPTILEIVLEPSNWATLSLQAMAGLGTAASYALYQNTWRYVNTHAKVTAALPTATWIELLLGRSGYVEDDPEEGKKVVRYGDFKRRILLDAIRRVNELPALGYTLELKEIKSGTRVSKLQFKFVLKETASLGIPLTWPADIVATLRAMGFSSKEIEDMSESRSYEEVADSLLKMRHAEARLRLEGKSISSRKSYFSGILANVAQGAALDDLEHAKIEAEVRAQASQKAAQARQKKLQEEFSRHVAVSFTREFFDLPDAVREGVLNDFALAPEAKAASIFTKKGWTANNASALAVLRSWLAKTRPEILDRMLPDPQDKSFEAWMAWRLDQS